MGSEEGEKIGPTAVGGALQASLFELRPRPSRFRLEAKETEAITQEIKKMREEG